MLVDDLVTTVELARKLKVCRRTLLRLKQKGMPFVVVGPKTHRYRWADVERWLGEKAEGGRMKGEV